MLTWLETIFPVQPDWQWAGRAAVFIFAFSAGFVVGTYYLASVHASQDGGMSYGQPGGMEGDRG